MNESMSDEAVNRTAPATPGLLKIKEMQHLTGYQIEKLAQSYNYFAIQEHFANW